MARFFITTIFLLHTFVTLSYGQSIIYTYDGAGNRIKKEEHVENNVLSKKNNVASQIPVLQQTRNKYSLEYKNNMVKLVTNTNLLPVTLSIYNSLGQLVHNKEYNQISTIVSMNSFPDGIYIIHAVFKEESKTFRIEKK